MTDPRVTQPAPPPGPATAADGKYHVKEVAGFELVGTLGEGGMGKVFKARQKSIDRLVALKVLTPKLSEDKDYVQRFEREAKAAGKLSHPNIVAVIDRGEDKTGPKPIRWIAFEFIDGISLEGRIKKGRLPEREALKIMRDMAEALRYSSEKGLIHRDVKPDNILLTADGTPKLADLGLAKFENDNTQLTQTGIVMGTPHYMAPEQALGERDLDVRADIYALGLVFYRCLTGELPWTATSALAVLTRHINEDCPDPRAAVSEVSEPVVALLRRMTMRDRSGRARPEEVIQTATGILTGASRLGTAATHPGSPTHGGAGTVTEAAPRATNPAPKRTGAVGAPPHKPTSLKTASSGRAHATAPVNGAPRKTSSAVHNTLVSSGPVPPGSQSRAALIVAFLGCMVLAAIGTWAFDHRRRTHKPHEGSVAVVPSDSGGNVSTDPVPPPPPPVETTRPEGTPTEVKDPKPVEKPPETKDAPPVLSADDAKRLDEIVMHASKIAMDDGQIALDDLNSAIGHYPAARDQLQDAIDLLGFVTEANRFLRNPEAKPEEGRDITARFAEFAKRPRGGKDQVSKRVMAEIRGWDSAFGAIGKLHDYLRGEGPAPVATRPLADAKTGVAAGYGDQWTAIATKLIPAVHDFESGDAQAARKNADAVLAASLPSAIFERAREAAKYLSALAEVRAANPKLSAIDALELVKGADTLFARRLVKYDLTKADVPGRQIGWEWESGVGIVSPSFKDKVPRPDGITLGMLAPGAEVRVKLSHKKATVAQVVGGKASEVLDKVLLVPELRKLAPTEEHRFESEAKDVVFELVGTAHAVNVKEGSKTVVLDHGLEEGFWLHGRNITVKEITYFRCFR